MLTPEQIIERQTGIGGSETAAILGIDRFKQPYDIWARKVGLVERDPEEPDDTDPRFFGNVLEDTIARLYAARMSRITGGDVRLRRVNRTATHRDYPWLKATIDRQVVGERIGLEIKNVDSRLGWQADDELGRPVWGAPYTDEVAPYYMPQSMQYLEVFGHERWDVAAYFGGADLRIYHLHPVPEWSELIVEATHDFWHNHVLTGEPPEFDFEHKYADDTLRLIYRTVEAGRVVTLGEDAVRWHQIALEAAEHAKRYQEVADGARRHIRFLVGDAQFGVMPDGSAYVRSITKRSGYTVEPTEYVTVRHTKKPKLPSPAAAINPSQETLDHVQSDRGTTAAED